MKIAQAIEILKTSREFFFKTFNEKKMNDVNLKCSELKKNYELYKSLR